MRGPYTIAADGGSITCHRCDRTSYNMNDVDNHYCYACRLFLDDIILTAWVIYKHPSDAPGHWVLRPQDALRGGQILPRKERHAALTLDEVRKQLPPGLTNIGRFELDDPVIHECWI